MNEASEEQRKKRRAYIMLLNGHPIAYFTNLKGLVEVIRKEYPHFPSNYFAISRMNKYPRVFNCEHGEFRLYRMEQNEMIPYAITKEQLLNKGLIDESDVNS